MSAQIPNMLIYDEEVFCLIATTNDDFRFEPGKYRIRAKRLSTACHRGYYCCYKVLGDSLLLDKVYINCSDNNLKEINGKGILRHKDTGKPVYNEEGFCIYDDLGVSFEDYTGKILCGKEFISEYGKRIGFQPYYVYEEIKELVFEKGKLVAVNDHSELGKKVRECIEKTIIDKGLEDDAWLYRSIGSFTTKYFEKVSAEDLQQYWWVKIKR